MKDTKLIHVMIVDGEPTQLRALTDMLNKIKGKLDFDAEFFVTNDKIKFRDVKWMIDELYVLYKLGKKELSEDEQKN